MNARTVAFVAGLFAVAVVVGFGAGLAVTTVVNAVLPFQPSDDDTLRELVPVALAYLAWVATSLIIIVLGWRRLRRVR